jgi:uncharacterized protein YidB (DUF937 family)
MGLLDELLRGALAQGGLGQATGQPASSTAQAGGGTANTVMALLPVVLGMLAKGQGGRTAPGGGLGDLLEQLQRAGYGDQARSWVGTGANLPISPEAMSQVFGRDALSKIASQAGLSEQEASAGLTEVLPQVVDRLTPKGEMPDLDALASSVGDLRRRLGL